MHAIDYLLKPFDRQRFDRALMRVREQLEKSNLGKIDERLVSLISDLKSEKKYLERLVVKSVGRVFFLRTEEVDWIEDAGNYVKLHVRPRWAFDPRDDERTRSQAQSGQILANSSFDSGLRSDELSRSSAAIIP